ncbi:MAG: MalY/PatB family protein [Longibaculum sp.]
MKYDFNEVHNRLGTYCTQWDYIEDRFQEKDLIPFSISDTDFIIPKPITEKILEVAKHQIYGYTRWNHHDFKSSITNYFQRRFDTVLEEDWILYSPSVMYSVSLLIRLLSQPQDKVLTFNPMYDSFFTVIEDNDRQLVSHHLINQDGKFIIDFDLFEKQIQDCQLLLLCAPHNPTGRIWSEHEMDRMIEICQKYDVKIISDEIHMDIQVGQRKHLPLMKYYQKYQEIYTASSSSKTLNTPGLIGSYVIIPNVEVREAFLYHTRKRDFLNSASILGMYATMVGYTKCDDYIDQLNEYIRGNMQLVDDFLKKELPDFKFTQPDATYLAWIDARNVPFTSDEIQDALIHIGGIAIMKGETYGENVKKYLRMNLGCPRSKIEEGLKRMKKAMDTLYQK